MNTQAPDPLSRREREIMDIVYQLAPAAVTQVRDAMADPPSYSTVRTLMGTLEKKGHLSHTASGTKYVYSPTVDHSTAQRSALSRIVHSFFGGAPERAAVALLEMSGMDEDKLSELRQLVDEAREEGR
ncbi:MAG: BlaI/MecI/CopY family transcriptional regulator [Deltaproteobacteria bacterium]|nr:BlaI/MecI/CopY family transcriptional regulator [Deltaproteobacteria bacterium]